MRRASRAFVIVFAGAIGCRSRAAPTNDSAPSPSGAAAASTPTSGGVAFDCAALPAFSLTKAPTRPSAWARLVAAGARVPVHLASHHPLPSSEASALRAICEETAQGPWDSLSLADQVVAQNAALRLALLGNASPGSAHTLACARAVQRLALPTEVLAGLPREPEPALEEWLGPRTQWIVKSREGSPALHEQVVLDTARFQAIRVGTTRALFARLVAVDAQLRVFDTPFVGQIELRLGLSVDAPACVLERAADGMAGPGRLRAIDPETAPRTHTFHLVSPGRVGCGSCHFKGSPFDLADAEADDVRGALVHAASRERLERSIANLRAATAL